MQDLIRSGPNYWQHLVLVGPVRPSQNPMGTESRPLAEGGKAAMQVKGNLAHNIIFSHLVFLFCPLDLVKTVITEDNETIHIISVYREKILGPFATS